MNVLQVVQVMQVVQVVQALHFVAFFEHRSFSEGVSEEVSFLCENSAVFLCETLREILVFLASFSFLCPSEYGGEI